jgi:hypothetical protein
MWNIEDLNIKEREEVELWFLRRNRKKVWKLP